MDQSQGLKETASSNAKRGKFAVFLGTFVAVAFLAYRNLQPAPSPSPVNPPPVNAVPTSAANPPAIATQSSASKRSSSDRPTTQSSPEEDPQRPLVDTPIRREDPFPLTSVIKEGETVVLPGDGKVVDLKEESAIRFATEDVDSTWALETENKIFELFANDEELAHFVLTNAECKTTECKITLNVNSEEQYYRAATALTQALFEQENRVSITFADDEHHNKTLYLNR